MITQERLTELLHYNQDTGIFTWKVSLSNRVQVGHVVGEHITRGYKEISIDNKPYRAHRLAFLYMTGAFPINTVDHINHIRGDNRWGNLRDVSHCDNHKNQTIRRTNTSGHTGVYWNKQRTMWQSYITVNGKMLYLGRFINKDCAIAARKAAENKYNFHENHGASKP